MISGASLGGNGAKSIQNWKAESCHKPSSKQTLKKLPAGRQQVQDALPAQDSALLSCMEKTGPYTVAAPGVYELNLG